MRHSFDEIVKTEIQKLYSIEKQLLDALKMLEAIAENQEFKSAFATHRAQTETHVLRLEQICESHKWQPIGISSQVVLAMKKETLETLNGAEPSPTTDLILIASAQKAEHLEIASYNALVPLLKNLGDESSAALAKQTLEEEIETDKRLSALAETQETRKASVS